MKIYFGVIKDGISYNKVKKNLSDAGITILGYSPKLKIVKFKTDRIISETDFDFFITIEEERDDFSL